MAQPKPDWLEPSNRIQQVTQDGRACWKFSILKNDKPLAWDVANGNYGPGGRLLNPPQVNRRAEMSFAPADPKFKQNGPYNVRAGMTVTYGICMYFDPGWPINKSVNHDWKLPFQIHPPDNYQGKPYDGFHGISEHNGNITLATPGDPNGAPFYSAPVETGRWGPHDYYLVLKASKNQDGYVKIGDAKKRVIGQWNGTTFLTGPNGDYMYGPIIGLYMDAVSLTADAIIYLSGFEGPLPDIWEGDLLAQAAPAPTPTPTPTPAPAATSTPPAPQWLVDLRIHLRDLVSSNTITPEQALAELRIAYNAIATKLDTGSNWMK